MKIKASTILLVFVLFKMNYALIRIENSVCTTIDSNFSQFDVCEVKRRSGNPAGFYMKLRLLQVPVTNCLINMEFHHLQQEHALLLTNLTWDTCKALANHKKYPSFKVVYDLFLRYTNINHSCPYNHDLIIDDLKPSTFFMPVPNGNYLIKSNYVVGGQKRLSVDLYFKVD